MMNCVRFNCSDWVRFPPFETLFYVSFSSMPDCLLGFRGFRARDPVPNRRELTYDALPFMAYLTLQLEYQRTKWLILKVRKAVVFRVYGLRVLQRSRNARMVVFMVARIKNSNPGRWFVWISCCHVFQWQMCKLQRCSFRSRPKL